MRGNDSAYRDPLQGLRARVQELSQEVEAREAMISEEVDALLPRALAEAVVAGRARDREPPRTEAALLAAEALLRSYRDALDRAIELIPDIEAHRRALPAEAPEPALRVYPPLHELFITDLFRETYASLLRSLRHAMAVLDENAGIDELGNHRVRARFHAHGAPFVVLAQLGFDNKNAPAEAHVAVATSVAAAAPPLKLRPQRMLHGVGKALGLVREVELGDAVFDDYFLIQGENDAARTMLPPPVRKALLQVASFDIPTLHVGEGRAELTFRFEPNERALRGATVALAGIRSAPVRVELLRGGA